MRELLIHRPLALVAIGLVLGISAVQVWAAVFIFLALVLFCRNLKASLICTTALVLGALVAPTTSRVVFSKHWLDTDAIVTTVPKLYPEESVAQIDVNGTTLMMSGPPNIALAMGQSIHIKGEVKPLAEGSNRLADRGIQGRIWVQKPEIIQSAPWIYRVGQGWRNSFVSFADRTLSQRSAAAVEAVCFNVQSRLPDSDREEFARAGTIHAISASGLHVGILVLFLFGLMSFFPIPRHVQLGLVACVLLLYAIASGLHPPVIRAGIMAVVLSAAYLARREPDILSAVALAAIVQLCWDSTAIYDAGFQLTFVVLFAIGLFGTRPRNFSNSLPTQVKDRFVFQLKRGAFVFVVAAPLAAYDFGNVSLTSITANALTVVAIPFLVVAAMLAHLFSYISAAIATGIMVVVVQPLSGWLLFVTDHFGGEWAALTVPAFSGYWLLLAYGLMLVIWRVRLRPA